MSAQARTEMCAQYFSCTKERRRLNLFLSQTPRHCESVWLVHYRSDSNMQRSGVWIQMKGKRANRAKRGNISAGVLNFVYCLERKLVILSGRNMPL